MFLSETEKLDIISRTWTGEKTPVVPYVIEIGEPHFATTGFYHDDQAELQWNEAYNNARAQIADYGIPNIKPNIGIGMMAAAFGCESVVNEESDPWTKPLITKDNVSAVYRMQKPDVEHNPIFKKAYDRLRYIQSKTSRHVRLVNVPSPLVTASLIWEYTSFIQATIKYPREVHALLEIVTEATIDFFQNHLEMMRNPVSMGHEICHIPREVGIRISDDTAALLSPKLYREFGVTYNARIAEAFGGIVIHSCGDLKHVLPVMMETPGLRGIDLTIPQNSSWDVIKAAAVGKTVVNLRYCFWDHADQGVNLADYTTRLVEAFGRTGVLLHTSVPTLPDAIRLQKAINPLLS